MYRIGQEEIDALAKSLLSRDFFKINNSGQAVLRFEEEWKTLLGKQYALLMTSARETRSSSRRTPTSPRPSRCSRRARSR